MYVFDAGELAVITITSPTAGNGTGCLLLTALLRAKEQKEAISWCP
jgi:hypothetical protein